MKRILCLFTVLLLSAASLSCAAVEEFAMPGEPAQEDSRVVLSFLIPANADAITKEAAHLLCQKASALSDGALEITLSPHEDPARALQEGTCDIAWVDTADLVGLCPKLSLLQYPFLFDDYEHFAITLGNADVQAALNRPLAEQAGAKILAVFYHHSEGLLSMRQGAVADNLVGVRVVTGDPYLKAGLEAAGATVGAAKDGRPDEMLAAEPDVYIPFDATGLTALKNVDERLYFWKLNLQLNANWLLMAKGGTALDAKRTAALAEAAAYARGYHDDQRLLVENQKLTQEDSPMVMDLFSEHLHTGVRLVYQEKLAAELGWDKTLVNMLLQ